MTGIAGYRGLSWTPNSKALVFADRSPASTSLAVYVYSLETGERLQLTHPAPGASDDAPVVSPDGRYLAFIRWTRIAVMGNVFVQRLGDTSQPVGDPEQLSDDDRAESLAWAPDSRSIVYGIGGQGILGGNQTGLWRIPISGGHARAVLPNVRATRPSIARNGRLVYQNTTTDKNIWRIAGPEQHHATESQNPPEQLIASTAFDMSPQFSPDGQRIVFVSTRSGNYEVWACRSDASQTMP
jgi:Tol biopolymer transport system component